MKKAAYLFQIRTAHSVDARVFVVSPPLDGHQFVRVSASNFGATFLQDRSDPETYIFPCTPDGEVIDWAELDGSYRGGLSHARALEYAGYVIVDRPEDW